MKAALARAIRDETGKILIMVLILLVVGGLIMGPLLGLMSTGLASGQVYEKKLAELYAADAGVEDAKWHLQDDSRLASKLSPDCDPEWTADDIQWPVYYRLHDAVNRMQVGVNVTPVWLLKGLSGDLGLPADQPDVGDRWTGTVTGAINIDYRDNYVVDITTGESEARVDHLGVWLPPGYDYKEGSAQINGVGVDDERVADPDRRIPHQRGTALIWSLEDVTSFGDLAEISPDAPSGCTPARKFPHTVRLSFNYTGPGVPADNGEEDPLEARGFFPWIRLTDGPIAWDASAGVFHIRSRAASDLQSSAGTTVESYALRSVGRYTMSGGGAASAVRGDFIAIGNSLMTECWESASEPGPPCDYSCPWNIRNLLHLESSATIDDGAVPDDARIEKAYLYWTAWWEEDRADQEVTLKVNGEPVGGAAELNVQADRSYVVPNHDGHQYSCFADVTGQVRAITTEVNGTTFTVGDVSAVAATESRSGDYNLQSTNAGWSMVIIYSSAEKEARQIYLYHDMAIGLRKPDGEKDNAVAEFAVTGFLAPKLKGRDMGAQVAVFVAEGDAHLYPTYIRFKGEQSTGFHDLGDSVEDCPPDETHPQPPNPFCNVFNAFSTAKGFDPEPLPGQADGKISGVDIDVYTHDKDGVSLSDIIRPGDKSATINLETRFDFIMLVYVVFSVRSDAVPPGEGVHIGTMTYRIG